MSEQIALRKSNPLLPAEDYVAMRKQGFQAIEKLGSAVWTDYNNSDPGITILEAVCYAITDLAYRTGFEIKDLLTPEELGKDTWKQIFYTARQILHNNPLTISDYRKIIIDVKGVRNAWLTPSKDYEVPVWIDYNYYEKRKDYDCSCDDNKLKTCHGKLGLEPVSEAQTKEWIAKRIADINKRTAEISKRITDIDTRVAAIDAATAASKEGDVGELKIEKAKLLTEKKGLQSENAELAVESKELATPHIFPSKIIEFEGLYNVMVEYEEGIIEEERREVVRQQVVEKLAHRRNLCEDFLSINAVEYLDFGIGASIALYEYADPDEVLAQVFFAIYKYFTPSIPFYTIDQMLQKGYLVDEIFEGPALNHGFVDTAELEKTDLFRDIRLSDIINEVSDIEGIKAVTYLHLPFKGLNDETSGKNYFNEWVEYLKNENKIARIQPAMSQVMFCKERDFITYNTGSAKDKAPARMLKLFKDLKSIERKYKLNGHETDFDVPVGEYMELEDYYPVTYSLPMAYGVSERAGLPVDADDKRKVQALQLKGYLLFFEQLLKDHLVQLNHLRDLFSFDTHVKHSYFIEALTEIDDLKSLIIDHGNHGEGHYKEVLQDFVNSIQSIIETPDIFHKRRNRFLDHMLGRFGEDISEYEAISRWLTPGKVDERLIHDKCGILKNGEYYRISSNRGKGYDYSRMDFWDTENISGAERRIARLLGFEKIERRTLYPRSVVIDAVMEVDPKTKNSVQKKDKKGNPLNVIRLTDPDNNNATLITSVDVKEGCCTETLLNEMLKYADSRKYFKFHDDLKQRSRKTAGLIGTFWFELWDGTDMETAVLLASSERYDNKDNRDNAFKSLQKLMYAINSNEGLHLIEHLLLRPKFDEVFDEVGKPVNVNFLNICLDKCDLGIGLGENTDVPGYRKRIHRIPADKCYDKLPWVLEYLKFNDKTKKYDKAILVQEAFPDGTAVVPLKFRRYEALAKRVKDLHEFGSERINYGIVSNQEEQPEKIKYSFIIHGHKGIVLAQSPFIFNKQTKIQAQQNISIPDDIELEIEQLITYFEFQLDLYCTENPCDNNEDQYSFRTTVVLPCWPKRLRDATFRNLVEKKIETETPAHVHTRVVWLGVQEMQRFEKVYAEWLLEMAQTEMPGYEKVNPLVDVLNTLRPCGVCEDDCSHNPATYG
ncbi:MAG: hypothetical protein JWQ40_4463 [Segetibacter sp.]|nr:hypothetical protein [Segetibacter sp.]